MLYYAATGWFLRDLFSAFLFSYTSIHPDHREQFLNVSLMQVFMAIEIFPVAPLLKTSLLTLTEHKDENIKPRRYFN